MTQWRHTARHNCIPQHNNSKESCTPHQDSCSRPEGAVALLMYLICCCQSLVLVVGMAATICSCQVCIASSLVKQVVKQVVKQLLVKASSSRSYFTPSALPGTASYVHGGLLTPHMPACRTHTHLQHALFFTHTVCVGHTQKSRAQTQLQQSACAQPPHTRLSKQQLRCAAAHQLKTECTPCAIRLHQLHRSTD